MFKGGDLFYSLVQNSSDVMTILREDGTICFETPSMERILGYAPGELIGTNCFDLVHPEDLRGVMDVFEKVILNPDTPLVAKFRYRHKDGSWHVLESTGSNQIADPDISGIVVNSRDVTERERIEKELESHRRHLEELVERRTRELSVLNDKLRQSQKMEAVGLLAGGIAHDFNNILATIKGALYLLQKKVGRDSQPKKYLEQILSSVNKANDLTQSLLAFSTKKASGLKPLDLNAVVCDTEELLSLLAGDQIELDMRLTDLAPRVLGEATRIVQVLTNLAANARDAMTEGGKLTIETEVLEIDEAFRREHGFGAPGKYVLISVSDTGAGIEAGLREKIFEPFFTTKIVGKGSGLGLAIAYGIVKQHNGYIDVECGRMEGATFRVYLPVLRT